MVNAWSGTDAQLRVQYSLTDVAGLANIPTLADVAKAYDSLTAVTIVTNHLVSLYRLAGAEVNPLQLGEATTTITKEYFYLNLAELCIFFSRLKSGAQGQVIYGRQVNLQAVTIAMHNFLSDRSTAISVRERNEKAKQILGSYPTIESAATAIVQGVESMKVLKEKAKTDFKAFRELFPRLPDTTTAETYFVAYSGKEEALRRLYDTEEDVAILQARLFDDLCNYNCKKNNGK